MPDRRFSDARIEIERGTARVRLGTEFGSLIGQVVVDACYETYPASDRYGGNVNGGRQRLRCPHPQKGSES